ncbi:Kinesin-like protein kif2c [Allomyces javanicus]|nr:Kinesin-like protein kif2c [Allomyces javanicus]
MSAFAVPAALLRSSQARQERLRAQQDERASAASTSAASAPATDTGTGAQSRRASSNSTRKTWAHSGPPSRPGSAAAMASRTAAHARAPAAATTTAPALDTNSPLKEIERIKAARELRRKQAELIREARAGKDETDMMVEEYEAKIHQFRHAWMQWVESWKGRRTAQALAEWDAPIQVCVRKRPISNKEAGKKGFDIITTTTAVHPHACAFLHEPKLSLDRSRSIVTHPFHFDKVFDEYAGNDLIFQTTLQPAIPKLKEGKNVSLFCYGATGSGKTHTVFGPEGGRGSATTAADIGLYHYACSQVFGVAAEMGADVFVSFLEIYSGKVVDLLNNRQPINLLEQNGNFLFQGLRESHAASVQHCLQIMAVGTATRTTQATDSNSTSSRSHAIFRLELRVPNTGVTSLLTLIDLAGSERGVDNPSATAAVRREGAAINKSLLALKECIRALHVNSNYVPFRSNKLTCVLRDCFRAGTCIMVLNVAPTNLTVEQTMSCLHYANRIKEYSHATGGGNGGAGGGMPLPATAEDLLAQLSALTPSPVEESVGFGRDPDLDASAANESGYEDESFEHDDESISTPASDGEDRTPHVARRSPPVATNLPASPSSDSAEGSSPDLASPPVAPQLPGSGPALSDDGATALLDLHVSSLHTILDLAKEEEALIDDCIDGVIEFDVYVAALEIMVDEKMRRLAELKDRIHQVRGPGV